MARLTDLFESVIATFEANGWDTEILVGTRALDSDGSANRIVFVPQGGKPSMGPIRMTTDGIATMNAECIAYIWGASVSETDDLARYAAADLLLEKLLNAFHVDASGRIDPMSMSIDATTKIATFGEQYQLRFTFTYQIQKLPGLEPLPGTPRLTAVAVVHAP